MEGKLAGKVAIIIGGGAGTGLVIAKNFLSESARVFIVDTSTASAETDPELRNAALTKTVAFFEADVAKEKTAVEYTDKVIEVFGGLHIAVFCTGVNCAYSLKQWVDTEVDDLDRMINDIVKCTFMGVKHVARVMKPYAAEAQSRGQTCAMVLVCSTDGMQGSIGRSAYVSAQWAMRGLSLTAAQEFGSANIRVNAVYADAMDMAILQSAAPSLSMSSNNPLGVFATGTDISNAIIFLASDEASYVNGASVGVHGGSVPS